MDSLDEAPKLSLTVQVNPKCHLVEAILSDYGAFNISSGMHLRWLRYKTGKNSSESVAQNQTTTVESLTKN